MNLIGTFTLIRREVDRAQRVAIQALVTPWLSALLFILVFGKIVGSRIGHIEGVTYVQFVLPGTLMMNVLMSTFSQSSMALYFQRFLKNIEEVLVAPISYGEMILAFVASGVIRGLVVGAGIMLIGLLFGATTLTHPLWFIFYISMVSLLFSLLGLLVGLWANGFEALSLVPTFLITPLTFLGGMFNSIDMLPPTFQTIVRFNPFFYMVDGLRYSMVGVSDSNLLIGRVMLVTLTVGSFVLVQHLFARGWRLRG